MNNIFIPQNEIYNDALVYASMKNSLISGSQLSDFDQILVPPVSLNVITHEGKEAAKKTLDDILAKTTIKRACCMMSENDDERKVKVRIPTPNGIIHDTSSTQGQLAHQYNYLDVPVTVSKSLCNIVPGYAEGNYHHTSNCDNFYEVYCNNIVENYKKENNNQFDYVKFEYYKPECACYAPKPDYLSQYSITPECFLPGCTVGSNAYMDPISRNSECDLTICNTEFNVSDVGTNGGNVAVNSVIEQTCGQAGIKPQSPTSSNDEPTNSGSTNGRPTNGEPTNDRPTNGGSTNGRPTDGGPTNGRPTNGRPTNGRPTNGGSTNGRPTDGGPTNGGPTNGGPTNGGPTITKTATINGESRTTNDTQSSIMDTIKKNKLVIGIVGGVIFILFIIFIIFIFVMMGGKNKNKRRTITNRY